MRYYIQPKITIYCIKTLLSNNSNADTGHPTIGLRLHQALDKGAKLIVADPREIGNTN